MPCQIKPKEVKVTEDVRKIRSARSVEQPSDVVGDADLADKVRKFIQISERLTEKRRKYAKELKPLEQEVKKLQEELREAAKELNVSELSATDGGKVEFKPRVARRIVPIAFLKFLSKIGRKADFWGYVTVPVGDAVSDFGERILEKEGVLEVEVDDYGTVSIV